jgi:ABC-type multidrug transport system permease subunit
MLLHRTWLSKIRDTNEIFSQIAKAVVVGILFGAVWWDKGSPGEPLYEDGHMSSDTIAVTSLLFMISVYSVLGNTQAIPYLCSSIVIYRRELVANAYSPLPFWFAMVFTLVPLLISFNFIFLFIIYFMTNLPSGAAYFFYYVTLVTLANYCGYASCLAIAANAPSEDLALKLFPLLFFFLCMYAGFAIRLDDLPTMWIFMPYIGYIRWVFEGLMINEFNSGSAIFIELGAITSLKFLFLYI